MDKQDFVSLVQDFMDMNLTESASVRRWLNWMAGIRSTRCVCSANWKPKLAARFQSLRFCRLTP